MSCDFKTITHGKWILAGEHAVVRGHGALVFPVKEKQLILSYQSSPDTLSAEYEGESAADIHMLFWSVLEQGIQQLGRSVNTLTGKFHLLNNIPIGAGMGASAALCVAMTRWFVSQKLLAEERIYSFAKSLENLFHGQSSGLDIAGSSADSGVYFQQGDWQALNLAWQPRWYLSSCAQIGITSHCIQQVQALWKNNPQRAANIDTEMNESVLQAKRALESKAVDAVASLTAAIEKASQCFRQWGLISESLDHHMLQLLQQGARAAKPTGSGGGGFVLSLWDTEPPAALEKDLIPA